MKKYNQQWKKLEKSGKSQWWKMKPPEKNSDEKP